MTRPRPAGQHTVRRHNSALVLESIAEAPGLSRADVAVRTGLTKTTVSSLVDRLISAGLVVDAGPQQRPGPGRRGTALSLSATGPHGLGVEIGVDYLATYLVDLTGEVRKQRMRIGDNRSQSLNKVLARMARAVRTALNDAKLLGVSVGGVGIGIPGLVESATGLLRRAPNLGWHDVDLAAAVRERVDLDGVPVVVGNEANFAALAELWYGGHDGLRDFVHVSGEIGIGAGIVMDGALFEGVRGWGGEIGHLSVDPDGPLCSCGAHGCLERLAGQEWILRRSGLYGQEGNGDQNQGEACADPVRALVTRLEAGEDAALHAVHSAARWLGVGLAAVINLVDVPTVVLGGTYAALAPWLCGPLHDELHTRVVSAAWSPVRVLTSSLGTLAAVRGAAGSAVRAIIADPDPFVTASEAAAAGGTVFLPLGT